MIKLSLCLYKKGQGTFDNQHKNLKRAAPDLPAGVCWQEGRMFDDGVQDNEITGVTIAQSGQVLVQMRFDLCAVDNFDVELKKRLDSGWQIDDGDVYDL